MVVPFSTKWRGASTWVSVCSPMSTAERLSLSPLAICFAQRKWTGGSSAKMGEVSGQTAAEMSIQSMLLASRDTKALRRTLVGVGQSEEGYLFAKLAQQTKELLSLHRAFGIQQHQRDAVRPAESDDIRLVSG